MPVSSASQVRPCHAVILCHPQEISFNASVAKTYCDTVEASGHRTILRDLYRLPFDPLLKADERAGFSGYVLHQDVATELALLREADVVVLVYPIWFGTPPAMMKGYVDRVFGANFHYRAIRNRAEGATLQGKHLLSISTSGNSIQWLEQQGAWLSLLYVFDTYLKEAFSLSSTDHLHLGNISDRLKVRHADEELYRVAAKARETMVRLKTLHQQAPELQPWL